MKKILSIITLSLLGLANAGAQSDDVYYSNNDNYAYNNSYDNSYDNHSDNAYQDYSQNFYDELAPYGQWLDYPGYGNVWIPANVDADFSPYLTAGHWAYSDYGWTWVSDYDWGWAAFHYGRWFHDAAYGWMWMPGNEWAPAWVTWGSYNNTYCWAPLAPGYGFSSYYRPAANYWNFVACEHITQPYISRYVVDHNECRHYNMNNVSVFNNVNSYNHVRFASGPRAEEVEQHTGHRIDRLNVSSASRPAENRVSGHDIQLYRPAMNRPAQAVRQNNQQYRNELSPARSNIQNQAIQRNYERPVQQAQFSQPVRNYSPEQPVQRNYERPVQQTQFSQPVRNYSPEQPVQRNYERPVQQAQFSQPARSFNPGPAAQRSFERSAAAPQFARQMSRGGRNR